MHKTQLEIDFVQFLAELSDGVNVRYRRWFETPSGEIDDNDYCTECAVIERWKRKHEKSRYTRISGWDEAETADSRSYCERCGCMLELSPTAECIASDIQFVSEADELGPETAADLRNWLTGMGDYRREIHWPMIKPHAERLMIAAWREVVPDGFIRYVPAENDWRPSDTIWLSIYQYFARKLVLWMGQQRIGERGYLVDTSGINISHFQVMTKPEDAYKCVQELLEHVGSDCGRGQFLASIGLYSLRTLENPIWIQDERCYLPTFDVRGRRLEKSPNQSHPDAVIVTHAEMWLSNDAEEWSYRLYYSDKHWERTSWSVSIYQNGVKPLQAFCDGVRQWMDEMLVPVGPEDRWRSHWHLMWDKVYAAAGVVFGFDANNFEQQEKLADALMTVEGLSCAQKKIPFTNDVAAMVFDLVENRKSR